ncbi:hypothetical protein BH18ACT12_BH18ACT12_23920 [soil metagenome]
MDEARAVIERLNRIELLERFMGLTIGGDFGSWPRSTLTPPPGPSCSAIRQLRRSRSRSQCAGIRGVIFW